MWAFVWRRWSKPWRSRDPDIFNSDQGAQFTSLDFTGRLAAAGIQISMDGRGRALDNVFVERLWRTVKYEEVYLKDYGTPREAIQGLESSFSYTIGSVRIRRWGTRHRRRCISVRTYSRLS